jgi:beta-glucosidase
MANVPGAEVRYAKAANLDNTQQLEDFDCWTESDLPRDPRSDEEILAEAVEVAKGCDVILGCFGEGREMFGEGTSRARICIPDCQRNAIARLLELNTTFVLLLFNGRPLVLQWEEEHIDTILDVFFPGTEAGHAIADVVFGDSVPTGRLTTSYPRVVGQLPLYYARAQTGHETGTWYQHGLSQYLDVPNEPLFPFGYGRTYTTFAYGNITVSPTSLHQNSTENITVRCNVTNTGHVAANVTAQMYIRQEFAEMTRPVKELKGFHKVVLKPGERKELTFTITDELLRYWHVDEFKQDAWQISDAGDFFVAICDDSSCNPQSHGVRFHLLPPAHGGAA